MTGAATAGGWEWEGTTVGAEGTRRLAAALAAVCRPGDVVLLVGGLGAGKTTFAQGFARGLGVPGPVTSPTFTLVREYAVAGQPDAGQPDAGRVRRLLHADVYRLDSLAEVVDLGLLEQVEEGAVVLVEWGDVAAPVLGDEVLTVALDRPGEGGEATGASGAGPGGKADEAEDERRAVRITARGPSWAARRRAVAEAVGAG
ncbi:MAG: tRNA (adenosine(37)-N6)-threonylcarbamoyltransferase complex ATPase subunit type 1 TsaE [Acidimicrobiales bacterium]